MRYHIWVVPCLLAYAIGVLDIAIGQHGKRVAPRQEKPPRRGAPDSTIEALLYELRSGLSCLSDSGARQRLRSCDEAAIQYIAAELLTWRDKGKPWLPPWSKEDVGKLIDAWEALR